jgi:hypothetical protein
MHQDMGYKNSRAAKETVIGRAIDWRTEMKSRWQNNASPLHLSMLSYAQRAFCLKERRKARNDFYYPVTSRLRLWGGSFLSLGVPDAVHVVSVCATLCV